ncbi:oxygen-independent coproporphyrinogen III oxidase [Hwanghaeella sp.]|uniref:oxygen-independent coproporphyrinogen III oxidase n=1 Tax=Hwanghaeella sp. TaxID=2605943 RepID=UPI003CCC0520
MPPVFQKYASMAVPRYTSYPTAPHFDAGIGARGYAGWLESLNPAEPVSLYLHVPFCRKLCWYCGCNMKLASRYEPVADYVETLIRELQLVADHLPGRVGLSHLHFGGGTPTALEPDDLERVMDAVRTHFTVNDGAELAIESDPRTLTGEMTRRIGALGFTRASFGIQEFDSKVQKAINRIQPAEMVADAVNGLRQAGITGINFDLIYGLPHQTVDTLRATIAACAVLKPDRLALFGYAHVPWMAKKQRLIDEAALPGAQERIDQAKAATDLIQAAGYQAIGLDHFALPDDALAIAARNGTLKRNFQGYTTDTAQTLLGVGATSIGRTPSGYVQNIAETGAWARSVDAGILPIAKGHAFQGEDIMRGHVIEELMCRGGIDLDATLRRYNAAPGSFDAEFADLAEMERDGMVTLDGHVLRLTEAGKPLVRTVAAVFDTYLATRNARHSVAV